MFGLLTLGNYIKGPIVYLFILPGLVGLRMDAAKTRRRSGMVRLVAVARIARPPPGLGNRRSR